MMISTPYCWAALAYEADVVRFTRAHPVLAWAIEADPHGEWTVTPITVHGGLSEAYVLRHPDGHFSLPWDVESGEFATAEEVIARLNQLPAEHRAAKEKEIARRGRLRIVKNDDDK
jgi:hypothetical protein